jgi:hypothetical protein
MTYVGLGYRPVTATPDVTGQNPGNWTCAFTSDMINVSQQRFELFHMFIEAPSLGDEEQARATVLLNTGKWDATLIGQLNSWDPSQPMPLIPGDEIFVMFAVPISSTPPPQATCWFRYQE